MYTRTGRRFERIRDGIVEGVAPGRLSAGIRRGAGAPRRYSFPSSLSRRSLLARQLVEVAHAEAVVGPLLVEDGAEALPHPPPPGGCFLATPPHGREEATRRRTARRVADRDAEIA